MLTIKPKLSYKLVCPVCKVKTNYQEVLWQGIHVCAATICPECNRRLIQDLPVGQATMTPYTVCLAKNEVFGEDSPAKSFFGNPLLSSLKKPNKQEVKLSVTILKKHKKVVILNCLDYLYGHCLLKLLNADRHLTSRQHGLVVLVPHFLQWLIPKDVAEIWSVDIPLTKAQSFYADLNHQITRQLDRFTEVWLSKAHSHPLDFRIEHFTKHSIHNPNQKDYRITFIWREDRPWSSNLYLALLAKKIGFLSPFMYSQQEKVIDFFKQIKKKLPQAELTVAGLGTSGSFPSWIDDQRVARFDSSNETHLIEIYSQSRVVIGVHGSSMLLPSAQAGASISLIPDDRLSNYAQDILYQQPIPQNDPRLYAFHYRYLPITLPASEVAKQVISLVTRREKVIRNYTS